MSENNKKYKILIVDDDDLLVGMYSTKFTNALMDVEVSRSHVEFFEKLKAGLLPDLILMDIIMPGMNGIDILKKMREEKLLQGVPVVMLTNQNDQKDIEAAKELGVKGYIVKASATPSEVVEEVKNILNKK